MRVRDFLTDILTGGPLQQTIIERATQHGFSYDQLKRAKKVLEAQTYKKKNVTCGPWYWRSYRTLQQQ